MDELIYLLESYWVIRDRDKEWYYRIKNTIPSFKKFVTEKLGLNIVVKTDFIKLEKYSEEPQDWMGIQHFDCIEEYIFFMLILIFLEDKGKTETFLLSELSEFIQGNYSENKTLDWTRHQHRRWLVKTLDFCIELEMLRIIEGNEKELLGNANAEVLFESNGLSRYVIRNFTEDILKYDSYEEMLKDMESKRSTVESSYRRNKVYRKVLFNPVVYNEGKEDKDYLYIKNYKGTIETDVSKYLGSSFHVHRNGALFIANEEKNFRDTFPSNKSISDIVLLINNEIVKGIETSIYKLNKEDVTILSNSEFLQIVNKVRKQHSSEWSKEYRECAFESLVKSIRDFMSGFNMIHVDEYNSVHVLPLSGKIIGEYTMKED